MNSENEMNHRVTSKEIILEKALELAIKEGVDQLSIRKLSKACGIAIGSIYNYYSNKEALVEAMAESFWNSIFQEQNQLYRKGIRFTQFLEQYYSFLYGKMMPYDNSWIRELEGKIPKENSLQLLQRVLMEDCDLNQSIWNMEFRPDSFCEYVFTNLMALLQSGEYNCRFFVFLLENLLYNE